VIDFLLRMITPYRPRNVQETIIEEEERNVPARDASRLIRRGRAVNFAYGPDGKMHLRRRARQIARDYGVGFQWRAMPRGQSQQFMARRSRLPWWWV
jgi:hypothetical protein